MICWFNEPETFAEFLGELEFWFWNPLLSFISRFCLETFFFVFSYLLQILPNRVILNGCRITIKSELKEKDSLLPWASSFLQCFLLYVNLDLLLCCSRVFDVAFVYRSKLYLFFVVFLEIFQALPLLVVMKTKTDETWYTDLMSLKQLQSFWGNRVLLFGTHCCAVSVLGFVWKYFFRFLVSFANCTKQGYPYWL